MIGILSIENSTDSDSVHSFYILTNQGKIRFSRRIQSEFVSN